MKALQKECAHCCLCSSSPAPGVGRLPAASQSVSPVGGRQRQRWSASPQPPPQLLEEASPGHTREGVEEPSRWQTASASGQAVSQARTGPKRSGSQAAPGRMLRHRRETPVPPARPATGLSGRAGGRAAWVSGPASILGPDCVVEVGMPCPLGPHTRTPSPDACLGSRGRHGDFRARRLASVKCHWQGAGAGAGSPVPLGRAPGSDVWLLPARLPAPRPAVCPSAAGLPA